MSPKKKKKETKPKPIDLKLTLENFGPLRKAEIKLKPMTIFIGPNNSGKTYAAMMFYSVFQSLQLAGAATSHPELMRGPPGAYSRAVRGQIASLLARVAKLSGEKLSEALPEDFVQDLVETTRTTMGTVLKEHISGCYGAALEELVRIGNGKTDLALGVETNLLSISLRPGQDALQIQPAKGSFKLPDGASAPILRHLLEDRNALESRKERDRYVLWALVLELAEIPMFGRLFSTFDRGMCYLPAARSGMLQARKAFTSSLLQQLPYAGFRKIQLPALVGTVSTFLSILADLPTSTTSLSSLAQKFEEELISGEIMVQRDRDLVPTEFSYRFRGGQIPLHRASSTVSELAPIFLFLKYLVEPGSVLIIEEPEAHLHPANQRILAKYLVRLVREGVNLIITTHSDYLFGQINNYVVWGKVREKRLKEKSSDLPEDYLNPEEVGAYLFKRDKRIKKGVAYRTEELEVTDEGFSEQEFVKVSHAMYDELVDLRRQIDPKEYLDDEW